LGGEGLEGGGIVLEPPFGEDVALAVGKFGHGLFQEAHAQGFFLILGQARLLADRFLVLQPVLPFALGIRAQGGVERGVGPGKAAIHRDHFGIQDP